MQDTYSIIKEYKTKETYFIMKSTIGLFTITALALLAQSPIVLGIALFGFCLNSVLDQVLLSAMEGSLYLKSLQIDHLQEQLADRN